jgi:hypothetical protein
MEGLLLKLFLPADLSKQGTINGATCAERAAAKPPPAHASRVTHWEEADMNSLGLTRFGVDADAIVAAGQPPRAFRCWSEDWEDTIVRNPDLEAQARFLNKYGGIVFRDGDDVFTVHPTRIYFCKKRGNSHWTLFCCKEGYNPDQSSRMTMSASKWTRTSMAWSMSTTKPISTRGSKRLSLLALWISMVCGPPLLMVVGCSPAARSRVSLSKVVGIWVVR